MQKRTLIPSNEQYQNTIRQLTDQNRFRTLIAVRMGCEMGLSRLEITNARLSDLDRIHSRGLWIEIAKKVKRGGVFQARSREIPVNSSLYALIKGFSQNGSLFILSREKGDPMQPLEPRNLNFLYTNACIPWSTHKSRHYYKNRLLDWMRTNKQVDFELIADLMGHKKTQTQQYGNISWDYKLKTIDEVFK
jgi:integrase